MKKRGCCDLSQTEQRVSWEGLQLNSTLRCQQPQARTVLVGGRIRRRKALGGVCTRTGRPALALPSPFAITG